MSGPLLLSSKTRFAKIAGYMSIENERLRGFLEDQAQCRGF
jgi:hypothetical protein